MGELEDDVHNCLAGQNVCGYWLILTLWTPSNNNSRPLGIASMSMEMCWKNPFHDVNNIFIMPDFQAYGS